MSSIGRGEERHPPAEEPNAGASESTSSAEDALEEARHGGESTVIQPDAPRAGGTVAPSIAREAHTGPVPSGEVPEEMRPAGETEEQYRGYLGEPVLTAGDGGEPVAELCRLLALAGHETPVSRGRAFPELTDDVYNAVEAFREEQDVDDELTRRGTRALVGPATWAALNRATGKAAA